MMKSRSLLNFLLFAAFLAGICAAVWFAVHGRPFGERGLGRSFDFDIEAFRHIDPELLVCAEAEAMPIDLDSLMGIAVDRSDNVYVGGEAAVVVMSSAGKILSRIDLQGQVRCLAVDPDGTLYAGIDDHVEVFNPAGVRSDTWQLPEKTGLPASIALRRENVYVTDAGNSLLLCYSKSGRLISKLGGFVLFSSPVFDVAVDPDDYLWVVNPGGRELRKYSDDLEVLASWQRVARTVDGFSGCCNPTDIAFRSDGSIVTSEKFIVRVKLLSPEGKLLGVVAGPDDFAEGITHLDLAVDSKNRILVLDADRRAVRVFVDKAKETT